ncbi:MAG: glycosyltransferase family 2 protein [Anaerolineae bacterium]|nr:glycosyltransferase family 2 protein [Anaerolineae bacterium]
MKLSIVIPCYNEMHTIEAIVEKVLQVQMALERELIIVDDYSTDGTRRYLDRINGHEEIKIVLHERNRGKGAALRSGFQHSTGDLILIQDADLEYDPNEYPKLIKPILDGHADVVYGSRFVGGESHRVLYFWHSLANRFLTFLSNMFTNLNLTDMEVCYKVFRKSVLDQINLTEDRFGFEPEFTAKIAALDCIIYEVGISYYGRTYDEGKKINWKDGLRAVYVILKYGLFRSR